MAAYLVKLKDAHAGQRKADAIIVSATDSANALAMAKAIFGEDSNAAWADATVATLADVAANAPGMEGWTLRVVVRGASGAAVVDVKVVGTPTDNTIDKIGDLMVIALNATAAIAGAAYVAATQILTVAAIGDAIGDKVLEVYYYPPGYTDLVGIPGLVGAIVDEGIAGAVLTVTFAVDTYVIPTVYGKITGRIE
jgi:hypothetical protein